MGRETRLRIGAWALATLILVACGNDSGEPDADPPEGEPCVAAGISETGCMCSTDRPPGSRVCLEEKIWGECECPPVRDCAPGQRVRCSLCGSETERRIVICEDGGTYDCSCPDDDRDGG
jgi:hypothetical protein